MDEAPRLRGSLVGWPTCVACGVVLATVLSAGAPAVASGVQIEASPLPGQLDLLQGTAIKLGGKADTGKTAPAGYHWAIVEGDGGKLYDADMPVAIFQAPAIDRELELFIVECTARYDGQDDATARLHIRVHRTAPAAPGKEDEPAKKSGDDTAWLEEMYRGEKQTQVRRDDRRTRIVGVPSHHYYPHWGYGYGWGWGWGGFIDYPVFVPIIVPGPGGSNGPGDGAWAEPMPVPYDDMVTTFPEEIAGRYLPQDYPFVGMDLPQVDMPVEAFDLPYLPADTFDAPMIDPGFAIDDFGW